MSATRNHHEKMPEPVTFDQLNAAMEPILVLLATLSKKLTLIDGKVARLDDRFEGIHHTMDKFEVMAKDIQNARSDAFSQVPVRNGDYPKIEITTTNKHEIANSRSTFHEAGKKIVINEQCSYLGDALVDDSDRNDRPTFMRHRLRAVKIFGVTRTRSIQACILGILIKFLFF